MSEGHGGAIFGEWCGVVVTDKNAPNLLNELVLGERGLESLNLVALLLQNVLARDIDVLEKENLNVLGVEGLQLFGRTAMRKSPTPTCCRRR